MERDFDFVGLEIHSSRMWQLAQVDRAISFMAEKGFNALIFHQSDMMNRLVLPEKYVTVKTMWEKFSALRYFDIENNQNYINLVARRAKRRGIGFYLNFKEIFYPDEIPELYPFLMNPKNAVVCPSHPFWPEYIEACVEELCQRVPELSGVILSAGTHESRTSMTRQNPCGCERCRSMDVEQWYCNLFSAVYRPLKNHGIPLIVRDFTFTKGAQSTLLRAAEKAAPDVIVALKNTPHDYYPTFPNNPKIGTTKHREYVEFDTWGQFFGAGFFPVSIAEDLQQRMRFCRTKGVRGVWFRTDWEGMYENSTFNSCNMLNLYAAGRLAQNADADLDSVYQMWGMRGWIDSLQSGSYLPEPSAPKNPSAWKHMRTFMQASWQVMRKTVYVRDHWFCEDNMFPDSLDKAFKMMVKVHGRDDWEPGASQRLDPAKEENLLEIRREKQQALEQVEELRGLLAPEECGFSETTICQIDKLLALYRQYVEIGKHSCDVVFLTLLAERDRTETNRFAAKQAIKALLDVCTRTERMLAEGDDDYPQIVYWLLNVQRMKLLAADAERILQEPQEEITL